MHRDLEGAPEGPALKSDHWTSAAAADGVQLEHKAHATPLEQRIQETQTTSPPSTTSAAQVAQTETNTAGLAEKRPPQMRVGGMRRGRGRRARAGHNAAGNRLAQAEVQVSADAGQYFAGPADELAARRIRETVGSLMEGGHFFTPPQVQSQDTPEPITSNQSFTTGPLEQPSGMSADLSLGAHYRQGPSSGNNQNSIDSIMAAVVARHQLEQQQKQCDLLSRFASLHSLSAVASALQTQSQRSSAGPLQMGPPPPPISSQSTPFTSGQHFAQQHYAYTSQQHQRLGHLAAHTAAENGSAPLPMVNGNRHPLSVQVTASSSSPAAAPGPGPGKRRRGERKCRKVYGMARREVWCTQCKWKKACSRFPVASGAGAELNNSSRLDAGKADLPLQQQQRLLSELLDMSSSLHFARVQPAAGSFKS